MINFISKTILTAVVVICALSACSTSPDPRLYIIEPMAAAGTLVDDGPTVIVGPVTLPAHLDHKGIVTHEQRFRVSSAEFDRWAEPLDDNITRALCENMSVLIPSNQVVAYPLRTAHAVDYSVQVRVVAFGSNPDGQVELNVAWMIHDAGDTLVKLAKSRYSVSRRGNDVVDLVEAMSATVELLSRDIASAINSAPAQAIE